MNTMRTLCLPVALGTALLLAACGGGNDAVDPLAAIPASASESTVGMVGYLGSLPGLSADGHEPVSLDGYNPPTSETTEPESVS